MYSNWLVKQEPPDLEDDPNMEGMAQQCPEEETRREAQAVTKSGDPEDTVNLYQAGDAAKNTWSPIQDMLTEVYVSEEVKNLGTIEIKEGTTSISRFEKAGDAAKNTCNAIPNITTMLEIGKPMEMTEEPLLFEDDTTSTLQLDQELQGYNEGSSPQLKEELQGYDEKKVVLPPQLDEELQSDDVKKFVLYPPLYPKLQGDDEKIVSSPQLKEELQSDDEKVQLLLQLLEEELQSDDEFVLPCHTVGSKLLAPGPSQPQLSECDPQFGSGGSNAPKHKGKKRAEHTVVCGHPSQGWKMPRGPPPPGVVRHQAAMMRGGMGPEFFGRGPRPMGPAVQGGPGFAPGPPPGMQPGGPPGVPMPPGMHCPPPPAWGSMPPMYSPQWGQPLPPPQMQPAMPLGNHGFNVQGSNMPAMQCHFPSPVPPTLRPPPNMYQNVVPIQGPLPVPYMPPQPQTQPQNPGQTQPCCYMPIPFPPPVNLPPPLLQVNNSATSPAVASSAAVRESQDDAGTRDPHSSSPATDHRRSHRRRYRSRSGSRGREDDRRRSQTPVRDRTSESRERRYSSSRDRDREKDSGRSRLESRTWDRQSCSRERGRDRRSPPRPRRERSSSRSQKSMYRPRRSEHRSPDDQPSTSAATDPAEPKGESAKLPQMLQKLTPEEMLEQEKKVWVRSAPADLHYIRDEENTKIMRATPKLEALCKRFEHDLLKRAERVRAAKPKFELPPRRQKLRISKHRATCSPCDSSSDDSSSEEDESDLALEELERKKQHPDRLHPELWYNDPGEMNDGPLCRCSVRARRSGIRHGIYAGESGLKPCDLLTNNAHRLHHYRITISPPTNFLTKTPTIIKHDEHEFIFEGFSLLSHHPLEKLPTCKVIRFNIEYTILYIEEKLPENYVVEELELFGKFLFTELLELVDLDIHAAGDKDGCPRFHIMPRFVRELPDNGKEILSMNVVMAYLLESSKPLINESELPHLLQMPRFDWHNYVDEIKGMIVTYPGMKPCSMRVDQLDREQESRKRNEQQLEKEGTGEEGEDVKEGDKEKVAEKDEAPPEGSHAYPEIVHFGIRPQQLSYAGNPEYQKAWREYVKFRHLLANMPKPSFEEKRKLEAKENRLQEMRMQSKMKRDVTVAISSKGFYRSGIMCDVVQHAMLIPVLVCHLRFHQSLNILEDSIGYKFQNRYLLQLALTHPSYRENFGTNPDHARNSLTNCGIRQPEYGDRRIHYLNTRKRGINTLINIMSRFGKKQETESNITHNERLEFLGDAVVEFLSSIHLFHMFPDLEEGGLATYRAAIVQNQHLAVLAKNLKLDQFMLYAHGSDLCHDLELHHAMANCFEALMGALFLDGTIQEGDKVFAKTLYGDDKDLLDVWVNYPPHPLQEQEPNGDRKWIDSFPLLQKLTKFEEAIGVEFTHIRLLARAFTDRSIGYNNLTLGSNQRLEFLGDTVLQLIASEYLYKFFPEHHEGHLSLLRSSLVNNRTQAVVCDDLGMTEYALYSNPKAELKTKDRADLLEAFLGALYVDRGLDYCHVFCNVCFFPRLQDFILNQDWNDPKSKLQQCCLTLRTMDGGEPDIPVYKVIECKGPTNTRVYTVAVYFRAERLAKASGHSIQQAEMNAAKEALERSQDLFPQLTHQRKVIAKSMKKQRKPQKSPASSKGRSR